LFLGYNLIYGLGQSGIDMAAHFGGLVAGFAGGAILGHPLDAASVAGRTRRTLVLAAGAVLVLGGATFALPRPVDLQAEIHKFGDMEHRTLTLINDSAKKNEEGTVSNREFGELLTKIIPEWRAARDHLAALPALPARQAKVRDQLCDYITARADGWQLVADGIAKNDRALLEQGHQKRDLAERLAKEIGK
jgi:rhomboid protease GluP